MQRDDELQVQEGMKLSHLLSERLSILHVVDSIDPASGGMAESIRARGLKLVERGHHVEVVSLDDPTRPVVAAYPLHLHALGRGLTRWQYKPALQRGIKAKNPPHIWYSSYQEMKIRNFHRNYEKALGIADETPAARG